MKFILVQLVIRVWARVTIILYAGLFSVNNCLLVSVRR